MVPLLAQPDKSTAVMTAAMWVLLILVAVVVLVLIGLAVKRRLWDDDAGGGDGVTTGSPDRMAAGFTVGDLRRMRDAGEINDDEFERARERIVAAAKRRMAQDARRQGDPDKPPPDGPRTKDVDLIRDAEEG